MPELPEMENYLKLLTPLAVDKKIHQVEVWREKTINVSQDKFISQLKGEKIIEIERRGKQLLFHLSSHYTLVLHLMLGGWLYFSGSDQVEEGPTSQVIFTFETGERLFFCNLRLGYLHLYPTAEIDIVLKDLGPDVFSPGFTAELLSNTLTNRKSQLKALMVNQKLMAGVGNAYADEICYAARLRPTIKANSVKDEEIRELFVQYGQVLQRAVEYGGYMEEPLFQGDKLTGGYNEHFYVYDREGEQCFRCQDKVIKEIKAGRKVFYCPACQRD